MSKFKVDLSTISPQMRALGGFVVGLVVMLAAVKMLNMNTYNYDIIRLGVEYLWNGQNPWAGKLLYNDIFYYPPFSMLILGPILLMPQKIFVALGGALLIAWIFYRRAWVALAWFATNSFLLVALANGAVDMYAVGGGMLLLALGDDWYERWWGLVLRVLGYGLLLVKPQGGFFIVVLFILLRLDWKGVIGCLALYVLPFITLYPAWLYNMFVVPPSSQIISPQTIISAFGPAFALFVVAWLLLARRWQYWELGGALSMTLLPYGMYGIQLVQVFSGVRRLSAIPLIIVYSGALAALTWVTPPPDAAFYEFISPFMTIYNVGMVALSFILACYGEAGEGEIDVAGWLRSLWARFRRAN